MFTDGRMTYQEQHDAGQHIGRPADFCGQCINARKAPPLPASLRDCHGKSAWRTSTRVYEALGIRGRTIPRDMAGDFTVDGHRVRVMPARTAGPMLRRGLQGWRRRRHGFSHRIYFVVAAQHGERLIPMGRIHQAKF